MPALPQLVRKKPRIPLLGVILLVSTVILATALGIYALLSRSTLLMRAITLRQREAANVEELRSLGNSSVTEISVYDEYRSKKLAQITSPSEIDAFVCACTDVQVYVPNHHRYSSSWYLILRGEKTTELQCRYREGVPDQVFGHFVKKVGRSFQYSGSFRSSNLRAWFERNVEPQSSRDQANSSQ